MWERKVIHVWETAFDNQFVPSCWKQANHVAVVISQWKLPFHCIACKNSGVEPGYVTRNELTDCKWCQTSANNHHHHSLLCYAGTARLAPFYMASVKHIHSLSQLSPAKAVHGHGTLCVGANEPKCHHHSLSHHLIVFFLSISKLHPPLSSTPFYPYTSLGWCICHITNHIHMYMCKYNPIKYRLSQLTPDVAFTLKFILALKPIPYWLMMACTHLHAHSHCITCATSPITFVNAHACTIPFFNHYQQFLFAPLIHICIWCYAFIWHSSCWRMCHVIKCMATTSLRNAHLFVPPQSHLQLKVEGVYWHCMDILYWCWWWFLHFSYFHFQLLFYTVIPPVVLF
jgi:hypothetical protein